MRSRRSPRVVRPRSRPREAPSVPVARAAWGVVPVARAGLAVRRGARVVRVDLGAHHAVRVVLAGRAGLVAVRPEGAMVRRAVSVGTRVAVLVHPAVGPAAIARVAIDRASVGRVRASAHPDPVGRRRARRAPRAAATVGRWGRGSVNRIVRRADLDPAVRGRLAPVPRSRRPIGLMSPTVQPAVLKAGQPDPRHGGCTSCHRLSSGH